LGRAGVIRPGKVFALRVEPAVPIRFGSRTCALPANELSIELHLQFLPSTTEIRRIQIRRTSAKEGKSLGCLIAF
jgi:hypothetical protein